MKFEAEDELRGTVRPRASSLLVILTLIYPCGAAQLHNILSKHRPVHIAPQYSPGSEQHRTLRRVHTTSRDCGCLHLDGFSRGNTVSVNDTRVVHPPLKSACTARVIKVKQTAVRLDMVFAGLYNSSLTVRRRGDTRSGCCPCEGCAANHTRPSPAHKTPHHSTTQNNTTRYGREGVQRRDIDIRVNAAAY